MNNLGNSKDRASGSEVGRGLAMLKMRGKGRSKDKNERREHEMK